MFSSWKAFLLTIGVWLVLANVIGPESLFTHVTAWILGIVIAVRFFNWISQAWTPKPQQTQAKVPYAIDPDLQAKVDAEHAAMDREREAH